MFKLTSPPNVGQEVKDAAWYYPEPKERAERIKGFVAFGES